MNFVSSEKIIFLITALVCLSQCAKIELYDSADFAGDLVRIDLQVDECLNLKDVCMDNSICSVNSNDNCVYLYDEIDCTGNRLLIAPGTPCHNHLGACGNHFWRKARSVMLC